MPSPLIPLARFERAKQTLSLALGPSLLEVVGRSCTERPPARDLLAEHLRLLLEPGPLAGDCEAGRFLAEVAVPPAFARCVAAKPHLVLLIVQVADDCGWFRGSESARELDGRYQGKVNVPVAVAVRNRGPVGAPRQGPPLRLGGCGLLLRDADRAYAEDLAHGALPSRTLSTYRT
jgi:hypothetical protein